MGDNPGSLPIGAKYKLTGSVVGAYRDGNGVLHQVTLGPEAGDDALNVAVKIDAVQSKRTSMSIASPSPEDYMYRLIYELEVTEQHWNQGKDYKFLFKHSALRKSLDDTECPPDRCAEGETYFVMKHYTGDESAHPGILCGNSRFKLMIRSDVSTKGGMPLGGGARFSQAQLSKAHYKVAPMNLLPRKTTRLWKSSNYVAYGGIKDSAI
ncbi:hypothetical protein CC1G_09513 [Coprinopsis cinerea okayama7|uniref:Uncharacterized protein n=1 Tax=Coprinopsis cinerea (strain Okayama-7 / 130 / ATCC MYA-4618 / FGSC 9003) TaxID=240176 RepID=A8P0T7_COPC7|nr:hypothetical protein CC1G_09513 [Coprinopsis cinerea okayama7\|eukprot:XP_001837962.1 hypothetical protein CC1G_09513 [Coprinopsis cinerea okayama7\